MNTENYFRKLFKEEACIQGLNAVPYFVNTSSCGGVILKKILGYGYSVFIYDHKNDYFEGHYSKADFARIWNIIKDKIKKDPNYLKKVKKDYEKKFASHKKFFRKINELNLTKVSDNELIGLLHKMLEAQIDSMGIAGIIEAIGIESETELKDLLRKEIKEQNNFNKYYIILTAPTKSSFIATEEKELLNVSRKKNSHKLLEKHLEKYYWLNYSYAGPEKLDFKKLKERIKKIDIKTNETQTNANKQKLIKTLKLSKKTKELLKIIDFSTTWQDERKVNVLITIGYADKIISEISSRLEIGKKTLYYLCVKDILEVKTLEDIYKLKNELKERRKGVFFVMSGDNKEEIVSGKDYKKIKKIKDQINKISKKDDNEIHGSIASGGAAIGRVKIIKYLNEINKIKKGDILVTSMTRPEFMPAIKKAAAIITDEGGITCHAAIVSRELGIPAVIATKVATKVLKDNMLVEVKANHGVVRILKRN